MKMSEAFPSRFLKAQDVMGRPVRATISGCTLEDLGDSRKPALSFNGRSKQLIVNKTNGALLAAWFGDDTDQWLGREIEIYADKAPMQGRIVDCLRVRLPQQSAAPWQAPQPAAPAAAPAAAGAPFDDDIKW